MKVNDIFKYVHELTVGDYKIYVAVTDSGKLRVGSKKQLQSAHMPRLPQWGSMDDAWLTIWEEGNFDKVSIHLKIIDGAVWCNIGKDLEPYDDEYPFLFVNKLRYLSFVKKAQEIEDKHDDHLRQQRLLNGIDLNR